MSAWPADREGEAVPAELGAPPALAPAGAAASYVPGGSPEEPEPPGPGVGGAEPPPAGESAAGVEGS